MRKHVLAWGLATALVAASSSPVDAAGKSKKATRVKQPAAPVAVMLDQKALEREIASVTLEKITSCIGAAKFNKMGVADRDPLYCEINPQYYNPDPLANPFENTFTGRQLAQMGKCHLMRMPDAPGEPYLDITVMPDSSVVADIRIAGKNIAAFQATMDLMREPSVLVGKASPSALANLTRHMQAARGACAAHTI